MSADLVPITKALLKRVEKDREALFEGASLPDGSIPDPADVVHLESIDALINRARQEIAAVEDQGR